MGARSGYLSDISGQSGGEGDAGGEAGGGGEGGEGGVHLFVEHR